MRDASIVSLNVCRSATSWRQAPPPLSASHRGSDAMHISLSAAARFACRLPMATLSTFCIACAKFTGGDRLGQAHAVLATSPYFVVYHVAVLVHARRELHMVFVLLGLLLVAGKHCSNRCWLALRKLAFLRHRCHRHWMLLLLCTDTQRTPAGLSSAIKNALQHPRPTAMCSLLGNCHKHGEW